MPASLTHALLGFPDAPDAGSYLAATGHGAKSVLPFQPFFLWAGIALLILMIPVLYRVATGPTAIDRIVAINVIGTKTAVLLVIIGTIFGKVEMFVDFALAYALLNFIGSLAAARYLHRYQQKNPPADELVPDSQPSSIK